MVIPDGERHSKMLLNDAHGKRIVNAFIRENVPSLVIGTAIDVLKANDELADSITVSDTAILNKTLVTAPAEADTDAIIGLLAKAMDNAKKIEAAA